MKPNQNKIIVYAICGFLAASVIFCLVATAYTFIDSTSSSSLKTKLAEHEKKTMAASSLEASRSQWFNVPATIDKFKKEYLLQMDDYAELCSQLPLIIAKNRLHIIAKKNIKYQYHHLYPDILQAGVSFAATGTYSDFKQFLHEITMLSYHQKMIFFRNIQISRQIQGDLIGDFRLEVYIAN